jgi:hypothetical protein
MGSYSRFRREVEERGAALRRLSADELLARAHTPKDTTRFGWRTGTISLIIDQPSQGGVRVIVQGFLRFPSWSPYARVALDGFYKLADGTLGEVPDEELGDFS